MSSAGAGFDALPDALQEEIWRRYLTLHSLAVASCVSRRWRVLSKMALKRKLEVSAEGGDLPLLAAQHNHLLLHGGEGGGHAASPVAAGPSRRRIQGYLPAALHYASQHCQSLQQLHLELPPPPAPLPAAAAAVARALAGGPLAEPPAPTAALAAAAADVGCPPVDGYVVKLLAQSCTGLCSLRLVNVTNNAAISRLVRLNDSCLALLARCCPQLEELVLGNRGGEDLIWSPAASFYLEDVTDAGLVALARHASRLARLALLRCSRVGDGGLVAVARGCRRLTALRLADCPGFSERALVQVGELCPGLRDLDCTVARRSSGLLLGGEEAEQQQLGFRAVFAVAANCPGLERLRVCEGCLEAPVLDDDALVVLAQGCTRLTSLTLLQCRGVTDGGARALASRCKALQELTLKHTSVGDAGVTALACGLPALTSLRLSSHLSLCRPGTAAASSGVTDAGLAAVAAHCTALRSLAVTGWRRVTDVGVLLLSLPPPLPPAAAAPRPVCSRLASLAVSHTAATDGAVCQLLGSCTALRSLALRGLLYSADATVARVAAACRHLTALDLRHCSTLSDSGLADVARLPFLRDLHLSFCVRITDAGLRQLAGAPAPPGGEPRPEPWPGTVRGAGSRVPAPLFPSGSVGWPGVGEEAARPRQAAREDAAWAEGSGSGGRRRGCAALREVELYHVPQVTHHGVRQLVEACTHLAHINIGKCRLVRADELEALLAARGVRLSAAHYLGGS